MNHSILFSIFLLLFSCSLAYGFGNAHKVHGIGFGNQTTGGTDGTIYFVTSLNDNGYGSLRYIIDTAKRPAIIKFSNCGTITLNSRLRIKQGDLTIDGSDCHNGYGIQIKNYPLLLQNVQNIILTNIGFRLGTDAPMSKAQFQSSDPLEVQCSQDIILNHLSIYWGTDENLSIYCFKENEGNPSSRISLQHSIIAEALKTPQVLAPQQHSMGMYLDGKVNDITIYGNLFASNSDRNPLIAPEGFSKNESGTTRVQLINNMSYQTIYTLKTGNNSGPVWQVQLDVIGNIIKESSDTYRPGLNQKPMFLHQIRSKQPVTAYIKNNLDINRHSSNEPDINIFQYGYEKPGSASVNAAAKEAKFVLSQSPLTDIAKIPVIPAQYLETFILANAGKMLPFRDPIDQKLITNIKDDRPNHLGGQQALDEQGSYMTNNWQCLEE